MKETLGASLHTSALDRRTRFPSEVPAYVHGVSDRAGLWHTSRYRCTQWNLPRSPTASVSRSFRG
jgi:hypothetical protein